MSTGHRSSSSPPAGSAAATAVANPRVAAGDLPAQAAPLGDLRAATDATAANERLTSLIGAVLIVVLAALGVTIVRLRPLLWEHLFIGLLLVPPVALKLASTGYRFTRYYLRAPAYVRRGPPHALLRFVIAPVVVTSTVAVLATGIVLLAAGPGARDPWLQLHKVSFIVWIAFTALHVLAHLPTVSRSLRDEIASPSAVHDPLGGRLGRVFSVTGALAAGAVLAIAFIPRYAPWLSLRAVHH
jgi:hypothetical protein